MTDPAFHTITGKDAWEKLVHIENVVIDIQQGQVRQNGMLGTHDVMVKDHEARLRALDFKFYGVIAGVTGAVLYLILNGVALPS